MMSTEMSKAVFPSDVYEEDGPARLAFEDLADKWALLILDRLAAGSARFNMLKRDIKYISQKVLARVLKRLERNGLVSRHAIATVPVTVSYALTPLGRQLSGPVAALVHWSEQNVEALLAAQKRYEVASSSREAEVDHDQASDALV
jgi:DNA-binding HxlR family transcriptional regulator